MSLAELYESAVPAALDVGVVARPFEPMRPVPLADVDATGIAAWDRLADCAADPNPFFRPDFVHAAARAHGDEPLLLVGRRGHEWVFCLPVLRAKRWRRLRLRSLVPWMPGVVFL